jgi:hypothetical protein
LLSDFHELVKSINRVRAFVRDFFVFSWRSRWDQKRKSARSYDNEKRRIECWFEGKYKRKTYDSDDFLIFSLSVAGGIDFDRNPLYEVWRTRRFLPNDLSLHFFILDLLSSDKLDNGEGFTAEEVTDEILNRYDKLFEVSTVRTKLNEYLDNGILQAQKKGRRLLYSIYPLSCKSGGVAEMLGALDFFTEAAPFGVIGSYIQDEAQRENEVFQFQHDFIAQTLDDEVLFDLLEAIHERRTVTLQIWREKNPDAGNAGKKAKEGWEIYKEQVSPLKILVSVRNGRRYAAVKDSRGISVRRLDRIHGLKTSDAESEFDKLRKELDALLRHSWGVVFENEKKKRGENHLEHIELRLSIDERSEKYVLERLMRERRNGTVERESENVFVYRNKIWNAKETLPFVKSFTGYILSFTSDNDDVVKTFHDDMEKMLEIYGAGRS